MTACAGAAGAGVMEKDDRAMTVAPDMVLTEGERRLQKRLGLAQAVIAAAAALLMLGDQFAPLAWNRYGLHPLSEAAITPLMLCVCLGILDGAMFAAVLRNRLLSTVGLVAGLVGLLPLAKLAGWGMPSWVAIVGVATPWAFVLLLWLTIPAPKPAPAVPGAS